METLRRDARTAVRLIAKRPGFSSIVLGTLALGIGATAAIFGVVNAVIFQGLPFHAPDQLVQVFGAEQRETLEFRPISYPDFLDWHDENEVFASFTAVDQASVNLTGSDRAELLEARFVGLSYFGVLQLRPALGRAFADDENRDADPVAVISDALWRRRFAADPGVIGAVIELNGVATSVVGVMEPGFSGIGGDIDVWLPLMNAVAVRSDRAKERFESRGEQFLTGLARLDPATSIHEAQANLEVISARLREEYPATNAERGAFVVSLEEQLLGEAKGAAAFLLGAVGLVLLIACANVANLRIARDTARRQEIALRQALGASRLRIVQHLVTESVIMALVGGALGVLVALWLTELISAMNPIALPSYVHIVVDGNVLGFTFLLSVVAGLVFGVVSALTVTDQRVAATLRGATRTTDGSTGPNALWSVRNAIVVAQLGLALVVLISAGLMIRSFVRKMAVDPGVDGENLLTLSVQLPATQYAAGDVRRFCEAVTERVGSLPAVDKVALTTNLPLSGRTSAATVTVADDAMTVPGEALRIYQHGVTPDFFEAMGIPLIAGRGFTGSDAADAERVVVVSETMANRVWGGEEVLGRRISVGGRDGPWYAVVGVVANVRHRRLVDNAAGNANDPDVYFALYQRPQLRLDIAVRSAAAPGVVAESIRREFRAIDPNVPLFNVVPFEELIHDQVALTRFASMQLGSYGIIALILAAVGLYGVISYSVTRRTNEIGIRMALGADPATVLKLVLRQGIRMIAGGVAIGLLGAFAGARIMASQLYGVTATDVPTYVAVTAILSSVGLLACLVPARRAIKLDPVKALKVE